LTIRHI